MEGFRYDAHPMGMLMASVGALSTFYPDARNIADAENRHMQIVRMIAKMPTLGAWSYRHAQESRSSTPTTTSATPPTSSRCCSR